MRGLDTNSSLLDIRFWIVGFAFSLVLLACGHFSSFRKTLVAIFDFVEKRCTILKSFLLICQCKFTTFNCFHIVFQ